MANEMQESEKTFDEIMKTHRQELEESLTLDGKIDLYRKDAEEVARVFLPGAPVTFYHEGQWYWGVIKTTFAHPLWVELFIVTGDDSKKLLEDYMCYKGKYLKIERIPGEELILTLRGHVKNSWITAGLDRPYSGENTRLGPK
jgi:hypothetical protein